MCFSHGIWFQVQFRLEWCLGQSDNLCCLVSLDVLLEARGARSVELQPSKQQQKQPDLFLSTYVLLLSEMVAGERGKHWCEAHVVDGPKNQIPVGQRYWILISRVLVSVELFLKLDECRNPQPHRYLPETPSQRIVNQILLIHHMECALCAFLLPAPFHSCGIFT